MLALLQQSQLFLDSLQQVVALLLAVVLLVVLLKLTEGLAAIDRRVLDILQAAVFI